MKKSYFARFVAASMLLCAAALIQPVQAQDAAARTKKFEKVYTTADQPASYRGGERDLMHLIAKNLSYPEKAARKAVSGTVVVAFVVGDDGNLYNFQVEKGLGHGLDEEAIRAIAATRQPWDPAMQNGQAVPYRYVVPVKFELPATKASNSAR